jgi:hypothetical protein
MDYFNVHIFLNIPFGTDFRGATLTQHGMKSQWREYNHQILPSLIRRRGLKRYHIDDGGDGIL